MKQITQDLTRQTFAGDGTAVLETFAVGDTVDGPLADELAAQGFAADPEPAKPAPKRAHSEG